MAEAKSTTAEPLGFEDHYEELTMDLLQARGIVGTCRAATRHEVETMDADAITNALHAAMDLLNRAYEHADAMREAHLAGGAA